MLNEDINLGGVERDRIDFLGLLNIQFKFEYIDLLSYLRALDWGPKNQNKASGCLHTLGVLMIEQHLPSEFGTDNEAPFQQSPSKQLYYMFLTPFLPDQDDNINSKITQSHFETRI